MTGLISRAIPLVIGTSIVQEEKLYHVTTSKKPQGKKRMSMQIVSEGKAQHIRLDHPGGIAQTSDRRLGNGDEQGMISAWFKFFWCVLNSEYIIRRWGTQ